MTMNDNQLQAKIAGSPYFSPDLAPTRQDQRTWSVRDMSMLWISMAACIPTYQLASGMIAKGMNCWQALLTVLVGNLVVLVPILLNAHAGTKYGIPFPIYCRSSFGVLGANIPALLRGMVACGWFGIQTWIGGEALYVLLTTMIPALKGGAVIGFFGVTWGHLLCFAAFWSLNMAIVFRGIESVRFLLNIKAPMIIVLGLLFLAWAYFAAKGFGPMLSRPSEFAEGGAKAGKFWVVFVTSLTAVVGFWSTLSLNIPDFSRFCRSQRDQVLGQAIGLPASMTFFAFIGIAVTSATFVIFGKTIWDPVQVLGQFKNPLVLVLAMVAICIATLATNIAANIVGPANDFANLYPGKISFRMGALLTGFLGMAVQPWNLIADPTRYMELWLAGYSSLLGAVGGILIADYYVLRRMKLEVADLYSGHGLYWYVGGFNPIAVVALILAVAPCVPGFVGNLFPTVFVSNFWMDLYPYAWFLSLAVGFVVHIIAMKIFGRMISMQ
jgi:NCS1 family nucleobase:cation symporter-1